MPEGKSHFFLRKTEQQLAASCIKKILNLTAGFNVYTYGFHKPRQNFHPAKLIQTFSRLDSPGGQNL